MRQYVTKASYNSPRCLFSTDRELKFRSLQHTRPRRNGSQRLECQRKNERCSASIRANREPQRGDDRQRLFFIDSARAARQPSRSCEQRKWIERGPHGTRQRIDLKTTPRTESPAEKSFRQDEIFGKNSRQTHVTMTRRPSSDGIPRTQLHADHSTASDVTTNRCDRKRHPDSPPEERSPRMTKRQLRLSLFNKIR